MCLNPKMVRQFFVVLALVLGVLVSILPSEQLMNLAYVTRFFEVQIPILAVGALLKYLMFSENK